MTLLIILALLIAAFLAYVASRPNTFRVERSASIKSPPEKIFPLINDMHAFNTWNPYERKDPNKGTYSGPPAGKGAGYAWESKKLGTGSMEILEARAPVKVTMALKFLKPMVASNICEFTIRPEGGGSEVTWAMHGPSTFFTKLLHTVLSMDKMVGTDFANGLANLKQLAEM